MQVRCGTSGFSYKEWKGPFYPADLANAAMLRWYAERLPAVEINNTFYRMPSAAALAGWAEQTPSGFRFVIKAPQRITHRARLADAGELVEQLWQACGALGDRLGPILFQLPPYFRKDGPRLRAFVEALPTPCRACFEFRHASWFDDEVYAILRARECALCIADTDDGGESAPVATAPWGYLRLRRTDYGDADLERWRERIAAQPWQEAFVFFKHEDEGAAPRLAARLASLFARHRSPC
jgi:uncharacterized protein YecE (DUF72 family)